MYGRIIIVLICNLLFIGSVLIMNADREKNAQVTLRKAVRMERDVDAEKFHRVSDYILPSFCSGEIFLSLFSIWVIWVGIYSRVTIYIHHS